MTGKKIRGCECLKYAAPEAFEVGGFGAVGHDGVVVAGAGGAG